MFLLGVYEPRLKGGYPKTGAEYPHLHRFSGSLQQGLGSNI